MSFELFSVEDAIKGEEERANKEFEDPYKEMCDHFDSIMKNSIKYEVEKELNKRKTTAMKLREYEEGL